MNHVDPQLSSFQPLDSNKFTSVKQKSEGFMCKLKNELKIAVDHRLNFKLKNGTFASVAMRETKPMPFIAHNWVTAKILDSRGSEKNIYLNINSLVKNTQLTPEIIMETGRLETFLNIKAQAPPTLNFAVDSKKAQTKLERSLEDLAEEANADRNLQLETSLVSAEEMEDALEYLDFYQSEMEKYLQEHKRSNSYVVLAKEDNGLSHNIEYYGRGKAFLRYQSDFNFGSFKKASKVIDLYSRELLVKAKVIIDSDGSLEEADKYRDARNLMLTTHKNRAGHYYNTCPMTMDEAEAEAAQGKGMEGVLQVKYFTAYTKEQIAEDGNIAKVRKAAIYSSLKRGEISDGPFKNSKERAQAIKGIISNAASFNRQGRCHNDIKGPNFLWSKVNGEIVTDIIDLGMVSELSNTQHYNSGTREYVPLEIYRSERPTQESQKIRYNKAKDGYALGVTILRDIYNITLPWEDNLEKASKSDALAKANALESMQNYNLNNESVAEKIPLAIRSIIISLMNPSPETRMTPEEAEIAFSQISEAELLKA